MNRYLFYGVLLSVPIYTWFKFYKEWKTSHEECEKRKLSAQRHNCIVMYKNSEMTGWPGTFTKSKNSVLSDMYEPVLHFIRTAEVSLDVAVMIINVQCLVDELLRAVKRNVKIRIITDTDYSRNSVVEQLVNKGISMLFYVAPDPNYSSILHFKYMVKDYTNTSGYLYVGSLNWTVTSVIQNYENINFITNHGVVEQFHDNFEESWRYIDEINSTNQIVKAKLNSVDF